MRRVRGWKGQGLSAVFYGFDTWDGLFGMIKPARSQAAFDRALVPIAHHMDVYRRSWIALVRVKEEPKAAVAKHNRQNRFTPA